MTTYRAQLHNSTSGKKRKFSICTKKKSPLFPRYIRTVDIPGKAISLLVRALGCDFFERRGEKRIDVGTLLAFLFFFFSDGVLCFCHNKCVVFLALVHLQVHVCANRHIDVCTWNPYLHTCNPNLLTSGSLSLSTFIARCRHRRRHHRRRRRRRRPRPRRRNYPLAWRLFPTAIAATVVFAARC
jgi:hypothetical protein